MTFKVCRSLIVYFILLLLVLPSLAKTEGGLCTGGCNEIKNMFSMSLESSKESSCKILMETETCKNLSPSSLKKKCSSEKKANSVAIYESAKGCLSGSWTFAKDFSDMAVSALNTIFSLKGMGSYLMDAYDFAESIWNFLVLDFTKAKDENPNLTKIDYAQEKIKSYFLEAYEDTTNKVKEISCMNVEAQSELMCRFYGDYISSLIGGKAAESGFKFMSEDFLKATTAKYKKEIESKKAPPVKSLQVLKTANLKPLDRYNSLKEKFPNLSRAQLKAIFKAHKDVPCVVYECTSAQLKMKSKIMAEAGISKEDRASLIRSGYAGHGAETQVSDVAGSFIHILEDNPTGIEVLTIGDFFDSAENVSPEVLDKLVDFLEKEGTIKFAETDKNSFKISNFRNLFSAQSPFQEVVENNVVALGSEAPFVVIDPLSTKNHLLQTIAIDIDNDRIGVASVQQDSKYEGEKLIGISDPNADDAPGTMSYILNQTEVTDRSTTDPIEHDKISFLGYREIDLREPADNWFSGGAIDSQTRGLQKALDRDGIKLSRNEKKELIRTLLPTLRESRMRFGNAIKMDDGSILWVEFDNKSSSAIRDNGKYISNVQILSNKKGKSIDFRTPNREQRNKLFEHTVRERGHFKCKSDSQSPSVTKFTTVLALDCSNSGSRQRTSDIRLEWDRMLDTAIVNLRHNNSRVRCQPKINGTRLDCVYKTRENRRDETLEMNVRICNEDDCKGLKRGDIISIYPSANSERFSHPDIHCLQCG